MTPTECNRWWEDFQAKYPSAGAWANKLTEIQWREIFSAWITVLEKTSLADALEVNRLMRTGEIPEVGSFDHERERIGHCVCSEAIALVRKRTPRVVRPDDWEHDRVKCRHCRDTGYVEVYRPKFLRFVLHLLNEGLSVANYREHGWRWGRITQCVICSCEAGEEKIFHGKPNDKPREVSKTRLPGVPRFNAERFYRVVLPCDPQIDRSREPAELVAEARSRDAAAWTQAAEWFAGVLEGLQPDYPEFEEWNDRKSASSGEPVNVDFKRP